jgi:hypothetical protein
MHEGIMNRHEVRTSYPSLKRSRKRKSDKQMTKSSFTMGQRCSKALYLNSKFPHLRPPITSLERKTLEAGKEVGRVARQTFPNGVLIKSLNTAQALQETQQAIDTGALTLYEAAFSYDNVLIRVDILSRETVDSPWDFYEVKATTYSDCTKEEKEEYRNDIAIQVWVLKNLGIPLRRISLMHLNKECRYPNLDDLFVCQDYAQEILQELFDIASCVHSLRITLSQEEVPNICIGPQCDKPRDCPFESYCRKDIPKPSIFNIPRNLKKWGQFERGVISTDDLMMSDLSSEIQKRALKCYQDNHPYFDKKAVSELLNLWEYPLAYLDFEAIDHAVPCYPGAHPYQHIPFQFSCHIQRSPDAELEHAEFLWTLPDDPRPAFIRELISKVPKMGSIVVYYAPYESTRLKELAEDFPEYSEQLNDIRDRLVDLMVVIQKGVYYPEFMGSFSIKKVAPAILGVTASYADLEIGDGVEAMLAYEKIITLPKDSEERQTLTDSLRKYCEQDTLMMVRLYNWLHRNSR